MKYRRLGNSGLNISELGLGGNNFGWYANEEDSIPVINHALELGINFIDTADAYDQGNSEKFVGKAVKGKRHQVIIATKFASPMGDGPNERGASRYYIMKAIDASLKRLQTDYVDLYQMHRPPHPSTPIEETLRALDDLVRAGKVRYIGCSNFAAWQLSEALWTSRVNNLHSFVTVQSRYSLLTREIEAEVVPCCQAHGIGVIPWGPLAGGFLTGKYRQGAKPLADARLTGASPRQIYEGVLSEANWKKLQQWEAFATTHGHTVGELAIAWLLAKPWVNTVIAGARKTEQVSANVTASQWKLTPDEVAQVDAIA
ncbi:MAG: Aldo/keto reductase [Dehalococcoidales bacterium]|nr:Aldo/keto reductase [Dehalococcoidales bacterium]